MIQNIFSLVLVFLSVKANCQFNRIDSLYSFKQVFAFIKTVYPNNFLYLDTSASYLDSFDTRIADSLNVKIENGGRWLKADINNDGKTDMVLFDDFALSDINFIITDGAGFKTYSTNYARKYGRSLERSMLPYIITIDKQTAIVLCHYFKNCRDKNRNYAQRYCRYYNYGSDTLMFKFDLPLTFTNNPEVHNIEKIELEDNGLCEGDCPRINVVIEPKTKSSQYTVAYHHPPYKIFTGAIAKNDIDTVMGILNYSNFPHLENEYGNDVFISDKTTTKWKIIYDGGKVKTISDYGQMSNATLNVLFHFIVDKILYENK